MPDFRMLSRGPRRAATACSDPFDLSDLRAMPSSGPNPEHTIEEVVFRPLPDEAKDRWAEVAEIFFLASSKKRFRSAEEKADFLRRWTGYYREQAAEHFLLAVAPDGRLAGYLTGCLDSAAADRLYRDLPHYGLFDDRFAAFPAHFHINLHPTFRSRGLGSRLAGAFVATCREREVAGVHVVTAPDARNAEFYRRLGLTEALVRPWQGRELLFLGRRLG